MSSTPDTGTSVPVEQPPHSSTSTSDSGVLDPEIRRLALVVILGAIMSILDTTIVVVAINTLSKDFHSPLATIQWVATGYLLALAMVIPLSGWAVERFGAKRMWILSLLLFMVGSAASGAAHSATELIAFRILQGAGGGMIMPIGQTILANAAGPHRMGRVMSVLGVPMLLGPVLGPVIGGLIVDSTSWRWIFYVNIPIGIIAIITAAKLLPSSRGGGSRHRLDILSLLLLSPGLAAIIYGLAELGQDASTPHVLVPIALGVVLIGGFVLHAQRSKIPPLIDIRLFLNRSFSAAALSTLAFGAALFGAMFVLPLYYQIDRGESALVAGLMMAPQGIGAALVMPLGGRLTDQRGAGRVVPAGLVIALIGTFIYTQLGAHTSYVELGISLFVRGVGFGFVMMPTMAAAYQTLRHDQVPRASTAINIVQRIGGSVGTALLAVVLERQFIAQVPAAAAAIASGATSLPPTLRLQLAPALARGFGHTFWWAIGLTLLSLAPAFFLPRHATAATGESGLLVEV
jgi:EmrB/QacA subfamily drug resistance transporter